MEYKQFLELIYDQESCKKIFEFVFEPPHGKYKNTFQCTENEIHVCGTMNDMGGTIDVYISFWSDGDVFFIQDEKDMPFERTFPFVDFVRSLGYTDKI